MQRYSNLQDPAAQHEQSSEENEEIIAEVEEVRPNSNSRTWKITIDEVTAQNTILKWNSSATGGLAHSICHDTSCLVSRRKPSSSATKSAIREDRLYILRPHSHAALWSVHSASADGTKFWSISYFFSVSSKVTPSLLHRLPLQYSVRVPGPIFITQFFRLIKNLTWVVGVVSNPATLRWDRPRYIS